MFLGISLVAPVVKTALPLQGAWVWYLEGNGTPLQYSCLENPWMEEPGRLQSMGSLGVGHNWATSPSLFSSMHWIRKWQPTPVFLPGESQGWRSLVGCCLWVAQNQTLLTRLSSSNSSHPYMTTGKTIALTRRTFVGKVMSLLFNMLSRLVITFLPRSKRLWISWLQSPSAVILEPPKIVCHCFHCFPIYLQWGDGTRCHDLCFLNVEL